MAAYQDPRRRPRKSKYARLDDIDRSHPYFGADSESRRASTPAQHPISERPNHPAPQTRPTPNGEKGLQGIPHVDPAEASPAPNPLSSDRIPRISDRAKPSPAKPEKRRTEAFGTEAVAAPRRSAASGNPHAARRTPRPAANPHPRTGKGRSVEPARNPGKPASGHPASRSRNQASSSHSSHADSARKGKSGGTRKRPPLNGTTSKKTQPAAPSTLALSKRGNANPRSGAKPAASRALAKQRRQSAPREPSAPAAAGAAAAIGNGMKRTAGRFGSWFAGNFKRSRRFAAIATAIIVLVVAGIVDFAINHDKIYANVTIGEVNVSGMTEDQAAEALRNTYSSRITGASIKIYADQDTMDKANSGEDIDNIEESEEVSTDEATANRKVWSTDASTLQARMEYGTLAKQAYEVGRNDGSIFERLHALFFGRNLDPTVSMNDSALSKLGTSIDKTLGKLRKNYDIKVVDGQASVTSGHDGNEVNLDWLRSQLQQRFTDGDNSASADSFVAQIEYAPLQITQDAAQSVADEVNDAIEDGATFTFEGKSWTASATQLGNWITTDVEKDGDSYKLNVAFKKDKAKSVILKHITPKFDSDDVKVTFEKSGNDGITVHTSATGDMPVISSALDTLQQDLFAKGADRSQAPTVSVESTSIPESMSVQAALDYGIITVVSSYTTEYTADADARNHNIHLAADLLDNSIIKANGGQWSFNDTAGECNADKGFEGAGVIIDGETVDEIGGGICQVATTVFNAVYEGGFDVITRHNHSLYIASYPDGRDAAISWPDLDLVWDNDSSNDLLMRTSHTDTTVTVELLGVPDGRTVSTETGAWKEGEKYSTVTQTDSSLAKGYSYVKQTGSDGKSITVVRTVKSAKGKVLHKDTFSSVYDARDEIVVKGSAS